MHLRYWTTLIGTSPYPKPPTNAYLVIAQNDIIKPKTKTKSNKTKTTTKDATPSSSSETLPTDEYAPAPYGDVPLYFVDYDLPKPPDEAQAQEHAIRMIAQC
jgi:hypothetical protein